MRAPVYNSRIPKMFPPSRLRWIIPALLFFSQIGFAADWRAPETQVAEKISAITGPGVIALEVTNRSTIAPADAEQIRRSLIADLGTSGIRVWDADKAAAIAKLTLAENLQSYVWVLEVQQGTNEANFSLISIPRADPSPAAQNLFPLTLHVIPVISRPEPILDFVILDGSPRRALVLGADAVTIYENKDNRWILGQSVPISRSQPFPRDVRGRIVLQKDHLFDTYLPGLVCRSANSSPLSATCTPSDDPWPLAAGVSGFFAPSRNFFTGALVPGIGKQKSAPAFYSAAALPRDKYTLWLFAGVDGQITLLDGLTQQIAVRLHWGSDMAAVHASCRAEAQVLGTSATVADEDTVQAFEVPDREPVAVSSKLSIEGSITALWSANSADVASLIYRNASTGNYEAAQLILGCSQ